MKSANVLTTLVVVVSSLITVPAQADRLISSNAVQPSESSYSDSLDYLISDPRSREKFFRFNSEYWKSKKNRLVMLADLVWSYPLIGTSREKIHDLLGTGIIDAQQPTIEYYDMRQYSKEHCGHGGVIYLYLTYDSQTGSLTCIQLRIGSSFEHSQPRSRAITENPGASTSVPKAVD